MSASTFNSSTFYLWLYVVDTPPLATTGQADLGSTLDSKSLPFIFATNATLAWSRSFQSLDIQHGPWIFCFGVLHFTQLAFLPPSKPLSPLEMMPCTFSVFGLREDSTQRASRIWILRSQPANRSGPHFGKPAWVSFFFWGGGGSLSFAPICFSRPNRSSSAGKCSGRETCSECQQHTYLSRVDYMCRALGPCSAGMGALINQDTYWYSHY